MFTPFILFFLKRKDRNLINLIKKNTIVFIEYFLFLLYGASCNVVYFYYLNCRLRERRRRGDRQKQKSVKE